MPSKIKKIPVLPEKSKEEVVRMQITFDKQMWYRLRAMTKAKALLSEQELIRLGMSQTLEAAGF